MNIEIPDIQAGKKRGTRDQTDNIYWITEKAKEFQKNIYFCFVDNAKAFDCVNHNKLWKVFQEKGIPDHLTCLPEKSVCRSRSKLEPDWFQVRKGVRQGCIVTLLI